MVLTRSVTPGQEFRFWGGHPTPLSHGRNYHRSHFTRHRQMFVYRYTSSPGRLQTGNLVLCIIAAQRMRRDITLRLERVGQPHDAVARTVSYEVAPKSSRSNFECPLVPGVLQV